MGCKNLLAMVLLAAPAVATAATPIDCDNQHSDTQITSIWPSLYLNGPNTLCFDVKGWREFSGTNCVTHGKGAQWTGLVIVMEDGESQGRDSTSFRVLKPVITDEHIEYVIQWSRGGEWRPMQHVSLNRLTGTAVSHFVTTHGGESYQCRVGKKAI